mgnify:CR=1 FL=1
MKLLNILLEVYKEEYELNLKEGLIKTTNIGKTLNILEKKYSSKFIFTKNINTNTFYIKTFSTNINTLLNGIIKDANNLGWFPSFMETEEYIGKWDEKYFKEGEIKLRFEAKFDEEIVEKMSLCSSPLPAGEDELKYSGLTACPSIQVKPPRIAESPINMECKIVDIMDIGHHRNIVIGNVIHYHIDDQFYDAENGEEDGAPIYFQPNISYYTR